MNTKEIINIMPSLKYIQLKNGGKQMLMYFIRHKTSRK